jgi:NADH-ubiquinone oxidoreductase chain 2
MSLILGPIINFNQNNRKSILAYSRISHAGWFITARICCQERWTPYFFSYRILLYIISKKTTHKTLLQQSLIINQTNLFIALFLLLRLGGLPPFLGFFPKIIILQTTIKLEFISLTIILLISSITDLFIYTRLSYIALINKKRNLIWIKKEKYFSFFILTISARLFSAIIIV